jgi:hypothetical protein
LLRRPGSLEPGRTHYRKNSSREAECSAWLYRQYLRIVGKYKKSLEKYPNPSGASLTNIGM